MNNKKLREHYQNILTRAKPFIQSAQNEVDSEMYNPKDIRFGLGLRLILSSEILHNSQLLTKEIQKVEPHQYYYPLTNIHATVLALISCTYNFKKEDIDVVRYIRSIECALEGVSSFEVEFNGVTTSTSSIMIQGFPKDDQLEKMRQNLRKVFKSSDLRQNIDERYAIIGLHATVMRYKKPIDYPTELLTTIQNFREHQLGSMRVNKIQFVYNDWYHRIDKTEVLSEFVLK